MEEIQYNGYNQHNRYSAFADAANMEINNEDEMAMDDIADDWYDAESGMNWVILDDILSDQYTDDLKADALGLEEVITEILSSSGKKVQRKCMNLFGQQICICQFLQMIKATKAAAN